MMAGVKAFEGKSTVGSALRKSANDVERVQRSWNPMTGMLSPAVAVSMLAVAVESSEA